jgi:putative transposase
MLTTRRRLPHQYSEGKWIFATWHLHGSLPQSRYPPPGKLSAGEAFVWIDRYLDTTATGPLYLRLEPIATIMVACLFRGVELGHYELGAWVLMANRVHVLRLPKIAPALLFRGLKGATAREANKVFGRTGNPFWQGESYDHWVRDDVETGRIGMYIESNPVKAALVSRPEDYRWSSASADTSVGAAGTSARATVT